MREPSSFIGREKRLRPFVDHVVDGTLFLRGPAVAQVHERICFLFRYGLVYFHAAVDARATDTTDKGSSATRAKAND